MRESELISLPAYTAKSIDGVFRRHRLALSTQGFWLLGGRNSRLRVLWLPHRSYWTTRFAALSLRQTDAKIRVLWFLRGEQAPEAWRRAIALFEHLPAAGR